MGAPVISADGVIYGVCLAGGAGNNGTVFALMPSPDGGTLRVLHTFSRAEEGDANADGARPWSGLAIDKQGSLFGTARFGGAAGNGVVFELARQPDGSYVYRVLHAFSAATGQLHDLRRNYDGAEPLSGVVIGLDGRLFGTASRGGDGGTGVVYELIPSGDGRYTYQRLHSFGPATGGAPIHVANRDGAYPRDCPTIGPTNVLFGATPTGGPAINGALYALWPTDKGTYRFQSLHLFGAADHNRHSNQDGAIPVGSLTLAASGCLYGATVSGGKYGQGTVFRLVISARTPSRLSPIYSFTKPERGFLHLGNVDGAIPCTGLTFGLHRTLYGATQAGGAYGAGTIYALSDRPGTGSRVRVLYNVGGNIDRQVIGGLAVRGRRLIGYTLMAGDTESSAAMVFALELHRRIR